MKNAYLDNVRYGEWNWETGNRGELELAAAYVRSDEQGFEVVVIDKFPRSYLSAFVAAAKAAGVNEIYCTGGWSNQLEVYMELDDLGLKLRGIIHLENAARKKDLERWGESDRPETIPALRFSFEEC